MLDNFSNVGNESATFRGELLGRVGDRIGGKEAVQGDIYLLVLFET